MKNDVNIIVNLPKTIKQQAKLYVIRERKSLSEYTRGLIIKDLLEKSVI